MKTIRYLLSAFVLLVGLTSLNAHAQSGEDQALSFFNDVIGVSYDDTDLAHQSLARVYGGFIFEMFGNAPDMPPTVLAKVLGFSNNLAMLLGVVVLGYMMLAGSVNTATSGKLLGNKWSSAWMPMRTALAFGMITPATDSYQVFSFAQKIIMALIIMGSNSGTWVWEKGIKEIGMGTPIFPTATIYTDDNRSVITDIMNCAVGRFNYYKEVNDEEKIKNGVGVAWYRAESADKPSRIYITKDGIDGLEGKVREIEFTDCGTIYAPSVTKTLDGSFSQDAGYDEYILGIDAPKWEKNMIESFDKKLGEAYIPYLNTTAALIYQIHLFGYTGKQIQAVLSESPGLRGESSKTLIEDLQKQAVLYKGLESAYVQYYETMIESITGNDSPAADWEKGMTEGGWFKAGALFFEGTRFQSLVYTLIGGITGGATKDESNGVKGLCGAIKDESYLLSFKRSLNNCDEIIADIHDKVSVLTAVRDFAKNDLSTEKVNSSVKGDVTTAYKVEMADESGKIDEKVFENFRTHLAVILLHGLTSIGCDSAAASGGSVGSCSDVATNTSGMISPFSMLSSMGHGMIQVSTMMWTVGLTAVTFAGSLANSVLSWGGAGGIGSGVYYLVASMMAALSALVSMGFILAYVIPFMPVVAWIMIIIGYLINTIEAMAAAPLAVIMLATPEGEGLSGANMQRAIQLVNAIILRPTLSVIGLFAAMTLAYTAFSLINTLFWTVASVQTGIAIFGFIAILGLYVSVCYQVVQQMVGMMSKIPNEILEWMAGGASREFGSNTHGSLTNMGNFNAVNTDSASAGFNAAKSSLSERRKAKGDKPKPGDEPDPDKS